MPFSTVFQLYRFGKCTHLCFSRVFLTSTLHNFLFGPLTSFSHNHCLLWTAVREERILSQRLSSIPEKEYRPSRGSNQQPLVLKSCTLPTELRGSVLKVEEQPQCIPCSTPLTITHVLVDCVDLALTRFYDVDNMAILLDTVKFEIL